ncbi:hypothetical protein FRB90_012418, partial [Tulasnella sp. 427]
HGHLRWRGERRVLRLRASHFVPLPLHRLLRPDLQEGRQASCQEGRRCRCGQGQRCCDQRCDQRPCRQRQWQGPL